MQHKITGVIAAPFTPMKENGDITPAKIAEYADFLQRNGVAGVFVNGTTGESLSLTREERLTLAEEWLKHQNENFKIIIHIGQNSIRDCIDFARHAAENNADAVGIMAPFFLKPSVKTLADFLTEVAAATPELPLYYYHMPAITGLTFPVLDILKATSHIPNLCGVKFTHENLMDFRSCLTLNDSQYDMLWGRDEIFIAGQRMGAEGWVGSTFNFMAPLYARILKHIEDGNITEAQKLQDISIESIKVIFGGGKDLSGGKAMMHLLGLDVGDTRLPLPSLKPFDMDQLKTDLQNVGFFEYCNK